MTEEIGLGVFEIPWNEKNPTGNRGCTVILATTAKEASLLFWEYLKVALGLSEDQVRVDASRIKKLRIDHPYVIGNYHVGPRLSRLKELHGGWDHVEVEG